MIDGRKLKIYLGGGAAPPEEPVERPSLAELSYRRPDKLGRPAICGSCVHWMPAEELCELHADNVAAPEDAACGLHVFGTPSGRNVPDLQPVEPELSGLRQEPLGWRCGSCCRFAPRGARGGVCTYAAGEQGAAPVVEADGRCMGWRAPA